MVNIEKYDNFIFDLDGTIWHWDYLIPGAKEVINSLSKKGKNIFFITNNAVLTIDGYKQKLKKMGINCGKIINPTLIAIDLLKNKSVYCIGEGIIKDLKKNGIKVSEKADAVLISEDRNINFKKFETASNLVFKGAKFYKTALGGTWIVGKKRIPGAGALAATVEICVRKNSELIGKPSKYMISEIKKLKLDPKKTMMIGDECRSDMELGNKLGFYTILVLTGRDNMKDVKNSERIQKPKMILSSVADMIKWT